MKTLKIGSLVLLCCLLISVSFVQAQRSVDDAVTWAEGQIGSNSDLNCPNNLSGKWEYMCMHFVGHIYDEVPSGFLTALIAWDSTSGIFGSKKEYKDLNAVPRGALVFFETGVPEGHVGLYVGNGKVIHAWTDEVRKENIEDIGTYLGWRWPIAWTNDSPETTKVNCDLLREYYSREFLSYGIEECLEVSYNPEDDEYFVLSLVEGQDYCLVTWFNVDPSQSIPTVLGYSTEIRTDYPEDPVTVNPHTESTDIHITHCKIRPYKEGSWHEEVDVDMAVGESYDIEMEVRIENRSNHDLEDIDVDYLVVKDKKDFDLDKRYRLEDEDADIDEGEKDNKHSGRIRVSISEDFKTITVSGEHSFSFSITEQNLWEKEITLYFHTDIETEDGKDRDLSDESKSDERGKLEIHLNIPEIEYSEEEKKEEISKGAIFLLLTI